MGVILEREMGSCINHRLHRFLRFHKNFLGFSSKSHADLEGEQS